MFCSNCGAEVKGNFYSKCGTKIEVVVENEKTESTNNEVQPIRKSSASKDKILIRSENCTSLIEENKKSSDKGVNSYLTTAGVIGILVMFSPYLIAALEDKKMSQAESVPLPIVILILAMIIIVWIAGTKQLKSARELYNKYKEYCSTEVLIVDEAKIYGSTTKGTITLTYEQIESVRFSPNVWSPTERKPIVQNDIFTVRDVVGNEFVFYSFSNCKDLKTVIDMQIRGIRDGNV